MSNPVEDDFQKYWQSMADHLSPEAAEAIALYVELAFYHGVTTAGLAICRHGHKVVMDAVDDHVARVYTKAVICKAQKTVAPAQ